MARSTIASVAFVLSVGVSVPAFAQSMQDIWKKAISSGATGALGIAPDAPPLDMSKTPLDPDFQDASSDRLVIGWGDLLPRHVSSETPFASLPEPLLEAMRTHVRWRTSKPQARSDGAFVAEHKAAKALLASQHVDVDGLMQRRREIIAQNGQAGSGPNTELIGKQVLLPGYVVPLVFEGNVVSEFLFVPVAGSCVHTPRPPSNQIVRVSYPSGFQFNSVFDAFWIEGELAAKETLSDVTFSDGAANVEAIYALKADSVRPF